MPEKTFIQKIKRLALIPVLVLALTGCAELPAAAPISPVNYQACLVTQDPVSEVAVSDLADYAIKQAAVTYGIKRSTAQTSPVKFAKAVKNVIKRGCSLLVITGTEFAPLLGKVVETYPKVNFVYVTEEAVPALILANLQNLAVYEIDLYEAGIVSGYIAASFSTNHTIALACSSSTSERYLEGVRTGANRFDSGTDTITTVDAREATLIPAADVLLTGGGCGASLDAASVTDRKIQIVDYGRDLYLRSGVESYKSQIVTTVIPQVADHLMEVISSDLEGDFIGGAIGSSNATYGNQGLVLAPNHEISVSDQILTSLQSITSDYEAGLKK